MTVKHRRSMIARRVNPVVCPPARPAPTAVVAVMAPPPPAPERALATTTPRPVAPHRPDPMRCAVAYVCTWNSVLEENKKGERANRRLIDTAFNDYLLEQQDNANRAAAGGAPTPLAPVLIHHADPTVPAWAEPVGRWVQWHTDGRGLLGVAEFDDTEAGEMALQGVWCGTFKGWSLRANVNGQRKTGVGKFFLPEVEITSADLIEAGPCYSGADKGAITVYARGEVFIPWDTYKYGIALDVVQALRGLPPIRRTRFED